MTPKDTIPMPHLRCPRCATVTDVPAGTAPMCPNCGLGAPGQPQAPVQPAPAPAQQPTGWGSAATTAAPAPMWGSQQQPGGYAQPGQHQAWGSPPYGAAAKPPGHGMVVAAWILGILGLLSPLLGIVGIILAALAKGKGHPKATAPLIVAIVCTVVGLVLGVYYALQIVGGQS